MWIDRLIRRRSLLAALGITVWGSTSAADDPFADDRERMVRDVDEDMRAVATTAGRGIDPRVLDALRKVPRHRFVPHEQQSMAYENRPLAIGHGQTISQPSVVALMTDLLELQPGDRVLEVGTGSGYQAAVLAQLAQRVYSIEIVRPLGEHAAGVLKALGYDNVELRIGDGYAGWPEAAPFQAIIVTAAPEHMPQPLIDQLAPGGRLVAPIGPQSGAQELLVLRKGADGSTVTRSVLAVRFVPLTRPR
jgi:protein-L-isoaspartate(D-aspartate) O-methyltransferase